MAGDYHSFIQFHHPGAEHGPDSGMGWNTYDRDHMRKFLELRGEWVDGDNSHHEGDLWAWGEWEAQSKLVRELDQSRGLRFPRHLWHPYHKPMAEYHRLQNTDPFIFGERFLYSNCKQTGKLKRLAPGSIIAFGSHFRGEWVLDTVFVVACASEYHTTDIRAALDDPALNAFLEVTGGPLAANGTARTLKLYRGATRAEPVRGTFSFFPAVPAGEDVGFKRPRISLNHEIFDDAQTWRENGRGSDLSAPELRGLWDSLVEQVRDAGLVLGTHAELPERREG